MDVQPTQLRLGLTRPHHDMRVVLDLNGLWVLVTPESPTTDDDVAATFADHGIPIELKPHLGVCFLVKYLPLLRSLPDNITLVPFESIRPLLEIVRSPLSAPATLTTGRSALVVEYHHGDVATRDELTPTQAAAFVELEVPFVATPSAWDRLDQLVRLPDVVARVSLNLDGYLEISTTRPQLVEASPLTGLFRIDATHFGLARAGAAEVATQAGFVTEPLPPLETPALAPLTIELSSHAEADLEHVVTSLAHYSAHVINWESGLGRRIVALAAISELDAWPALIVTPPSSLWAWQRHLDLLDHSYALGPSAADVELSTYVALTQRRSTPSVLSIVFDSPNSSTAKSARPALRRLASRRDAVRVAIESRWPEAIEDQIAIMELLRPGEFRSDVPVAMRYPPDAVTHATDHVNYYLSKRETGELIQETFRRSSVRVVDLVDAQLQAIEEATEYLSNKHPATALTELLDLVTAGPPEAVSPKITLAARLARQNKGSTAIVTRSKRAATLLRSLLKPAPVTLYEPASPAPVPEGLVIVRVDHQWPDLRGFNNVIVLDYPFSLATLDASVGPARDPGPATVVVHANHTLEDRLVVLATRRALASGVLDATAAPSLEEMAFLFDPSPI